MANATIRRGHMSREDIRRERRRARISQGALAKELGIAEVSYWKWEKRAEELPWLLAEADVAQALKRLIRRTTEL